MNAYELADQVEMWGEDLLALNMKGGIPVVQGAKMLRQQADRIAELEKQYDAMVMSFEARLATRGYEIQIRDQQDRIAELEKQIKPLSDEEIIDCINKRFDLGLKAGHATVLAFARAIEERHGIK